MATAHYNMFAMQAADTAAVSLRLALALMGLILLTLAVLVAPVVVLVVSIIILAVVVIICGDKTE